MRMIFIPTSPADMPAGVANLPIIKDPCKTRVSKSVPSGIQYNITDVASEIYLLFNISHYYHHDSMRAKCARHFLKLLHSLPLLYRCQISYFWWTIQNNISKILARSALDPSPSCRNFVLYFFSHDFYIIHYIPFFSTANIFHTLRTIARHVV